LEEKISLIFQETNNIAHISQTYHSYIMQWYTR